MGRKHRVAVVGGANIDLTAMPYEKYVAGDSCPGSLAVTYGGVGRNIAHNLALMGCKVSLVTVFGDDVFATGLKSDCERIGIDISRCATIAGKKSSMFISINDENGELMSAVAAMDIADCLTPEFVSSRIAFLNSFDVVVLEANLPSETIAYILDNCTVPVFADTVSAPKSHKIFNVLNGDRHIHTLKLNRVEAQELTDDDMADNEALGRVATLLHSKGVQRVFITLGSQGLYYGDCEGSRFVPCQKVSVVNASGAGDAFLSGVIFAFLKDLDINSTIRCAMRASALTLQCIEAVNPEINAKSLLYE